MHLYDFGIRPFSSQTLTHFHRRGDRHRKSEHTERKGLFYFIFFLLSFPLLRTDFRYTNGTAACWCIYLSTANWKEPDGFIRFISLVSHTHIIALHDAYTILNNRSRKFSFRLTHSRTLVRLVSRVAASTIHDIEYVSLMAWKFMWFVLCLLFGVQLAVLRCAPSPADGTIKVCRFSLLLLFFSRSHRILRTNSMTRSPMSNGQTNTN